MARSTDVVRSLSARAVAWSLAVCLGSVALAGCSRTHYRLRADVDAYSIIDQKTWQSPWRPPSDYSVDPPPASRLFDPTPPDDPLPPPPAPLLYAYDLPGFEPGGNTYPVRASGAPQAPLPASDAVYQVIRQASYAEPIDARPAILLAAAYTAWQDEPDELPPPALAGDTEIDIRPITIPREFWDSIPPACRERMLEFDSVRSEFLLSHEVSPQPASPGVPRLTLEQIVGLALLNNRDYQTDKERLYRAALRLTAERYEYAVKFQPFGSGTTADYRHMRDAGITENSLSVPSAARADAMLALGGDMIASFANDVVLTFNGPSGFAADVGSTALLGFTQTVFQRDIRFERLTQAERNVVYAARDLARARKSLFVQLARAYYNLLLTYRQVEIDSQNYFTLVRAYLHRQAELELRNRARVQVDQVEQSALQGRSSLIGTCNRVERSLDELKLLLGIPTETRINLDLEELEQLTLRDEVAVAAELVGRVRARLQTEWVKEEPAREELLTLAVELVTRAVETYVLQQRVGIETEELSRLQIVKARLSVDDARLQVGESRAELETYRGDAPSQFGLITRNQDLIDALLALLARQEQLARLLPDLQSAADQWQSQRAGWRQRAGQLADAVRQAVDDFQFERFAALLETAERLVAELEQAVQEADRTLGRNGDERRDEDDFEQSIGEFDTLLARSQALLEGASTGLADVRITADDAMLTALVLRLDLLNQRGFLGDDWRQIKLAADDLKSILNLNARQTIRTRDDVNRFFDFTFDESETRLSASLDTPFNRRRQRNTFRESLIDYQQARRNLMRAEDNIKFAVRNDLRSLDLTSEQYALGIDSAALAYERVVSTELQLRLGVAGVETRDFLEAQTAYTRSLSAVASLHIDQILNRMQLFLDLELLEVDETGFWPQLYDESYQPQPFYQLPGYALPPYGDLPGGVHYSPRIRRLLEIPPGRAGVLGEPELLPVEPQE